MEEKKRQGPQAVDFTFSADDPLTKEELALSYSKYYYVPFAPMNPLVSQILAAPVDPATCLTTFISKLRESQMGNIKDFIFVIICHNHYSLSGLMSKGNNLSPSLNRSKSEINERS